MLLSCTLVHGTTLDKYYLFNVLVNWVHAIHNNSSQTLKRKRWLEKCIWWFLFNVVHCIQILKHFIGNPYNRHFSNPKKARVCPRKHADHAWFCICLFGFKIMKNILLILLQSFFKTVRKYRRFSSPRDTSVVKINQNWKKWIFNEINMDNSIILYGAKVYSVCIVT